MLRCLALVFALLVATTVASTGAPRTGRTVTQHSHCVVVNGLANPNADWDVWQEIYQPAYPVWLKAHTHRGAECIMTFTGVTSWWFQHGTGPDSPPTIVPVPIGKPLYTVEGRVHNAGNTSPRVSMAYLGIHVLETGSDFNYPAPGPPVSPTATPLPANHEIRHFKYDFYQQKHLDGTFTIDNRIEVLPQGASYVRPGTQALAYYSVVTGSAVVTINHIGARMAENTSIAIPANTAATIAGTAAHAVLAVTVLLPGDCDKNPSLCAGP
jgi:hypothetical protein